MRRRLTSMLSIPTVAVGCGLFGPWPLIGATLVIVACVLIFVGADPHEHLRETE